MNRSQPTLCHAVDSNNEKEIKTLFQRGIDVNQPNENNMTPVAIAVKRNNLNMIKILAKMGADLNKNTHVVATPMFIAAAKGYHESLKLLTELGGDVSIRNLIGQTPLHVASSVGHVDAVRTLMDLGASVHSFDHERVTPLHAAVKNGHVHVIEVLVNHGADVNTPDLSGSLPITMAVINKQVETLRVLAMLGANINARNKCSATPIFVAARQGCAGLVKVLAMLGADVNATCPLAKEDLAVTRMESQMQKYAMATPVHIAALLGHSEVIKVLAESGADLNNASAPQEMELPLWIAIRREHFAAVRVLAECGADLNIASALWWGFTSMCVAGPRSSGQNRAFLTPLDYAIKNSMIDLIRALAAGDAQIATTVINGFTPMHQAAQYGRADVINTLAELGGDVNARDALGNTPLHVATEKRHEFAMRALMKLGAEVNALNKYGRTPLSLVSLGKGTCTIRLLVKYGANVNSRDNNGLTLAYMAAKRGYDDVLTTLVDLGADIELGIYTAPHSSPYTIAASKTSRRHHRVTDYLAQIGASVRHCWHHATHRHQVQEFSLRAHTSGDSIEAQCCLFSLTKLLTRAVATGGSVRRIAGSVANEDCTFHVLSETVVAAAVRAILCNDLSLETMQARPFLLRRRLSRIAWRVAREGTEALDGDRVTVETIARRYVEIWCLFLDTGMLDELLSLRMTCKSNHEAGRRRFPVCYAYYRELEANMMEEWVAYTSSRFVSTEVLHAVSRIHNNY